MADVAALAGVSEPLVFRYFPTKADLHAAVVRGWAEDLAARQDAAVAAVPPGAPVRDRVRALLEVLADDAASGRTVVARARLLPRRVGRGGRGRPGGPVGPPAGGCCRPTGSATTTPWRPGPASSRRRCAPGRVAAAPTTSAATWSRPRSARCRAPSATGAAEPGRARHGACPPAARHGAGSCPHGRRPGRPVRARDRARPRGARAARGRAPGGPGRRGGRDRRRRAPGRRPGRLRPGRDRRATRGRSRRGTGRRGTPRGARRGVPVLHRPGRAGDRAAGPAPAPGAAR